MYIFTVHSKALVTSRVLIKSFSFLTTQCSTGIILRKCKEEINYLFYLIHKKVADHNKRWLLINRVSSSSAFWEVRLRAYNTISNSLQSTWAAGPVRHPSPRESVDLTRETTARRSLRLSDNVSNAPGRRAPLSVRNLEQTLYRNKSRIGCKLSFTFSLI